MKAKRKRHSAAFKAKVGFEALVGLKTVLQLAREYTVDPTQVTQWRATIRDHLPELFEPGQPWTEEQEQLIAQLHQKIGQLTVDLDWLKKVQTTEALTCLQELVSPEPKISVRHQCELLELCRNSFYYQCRTEMAENLLLMRWLDALHLAYPVYGSRKLTVLLGQEGMAVNRKRVVRLLRVMGIEAIYAKPQTSLPEPGHQIYPYLLRDLAVTRLRAFYTKGFEHFIASIPASAATGWSVSCRLGFIFRLAHGSPAPFNGALRRILRTGTRE